MSPRAPFLALIFILGSFALSSCKSGDGPLLINMSGAALRLEVRSENGSTYEGSCDDQSAVWVGKSGVPTVRLEIQSGGQVYVVQGEELKTPFGKDRATAFVVEAAGPRKLTLKEAEILLLGRAK